MVKELKRGVQISTTFNRGFEIYKKNFLPILVASLLATVIGSISFFICFPPLICGLFAMILSAMRDNNATLQIGDVFKGFKKFLPSFAALILIAIILFIVCIILAIVPVIGAIAGLVVGYAVAPAVIYWAMLLIADQDASVGDAVLTPLKLLTDGRFWSIVLAAFVASLIGSIGTIVCLIGAIVTTPFTFCMIAAAYEEAYSDDASPDTPVTPEIETPVS